MMKTGQSCVNYRPMEAYLVDLNAFVMFFREIILNVPKINDLEKCSSGTRIPFFRVCRLDPSTFHKKKLIFWSVNLQNIKCGDF